MTIGLGALGAVLLVGQAWLLSRVINRVFIEGQALGDVGHLLWGLFGLVALRALALWGSDVAAGVIAGRIKHDLRVELFSHLMALGPAYTAGERTGELSTTLIDGIEALDAYFRQYLPRLALAALVPLLILLTVFPIDLLSGIVLLVTAPLIPVFMLLIGSLAGAVQRRQWKTLSRLSAYFLDVVQGLPTLKMFGRSQAQIETIGRISEQFRQATLGVLRVAFLSAFALEMIGTISTAIVAVEIGLRLLDARIAFEQALFILVLAPEFYLPMRALGASFHAATAGAAAAERIFAVLNTPIPSSPTKEDRHASAPTPPFYIRFEDVYLTYDRGEHDQSALNGVSFEIAPGEIVVLVGPSGAGKSSIAHLLMGFIRPEKGRILVNDAPLQDIPLPAWREQLTWLPQRPYLFNTTIAENIRLGHPDATPDEIRYAAEQAHAHKFISTLPDGYNTYVGEHGARLSGGQARRIALARAFMAKASFIILDEATAHLDPAHQSLIEESVRRLLRGRSALIIAHRLSTVSLADRIIYLDKGRIIESGTHHALLERSGPYQQLVSAYRRPV